jgi:hypothetical protein
LEATIGATAASKRLKCAPREDAGLLLGIDADVELPAARLGLARGARVLEHQRHEFRHALRFDAEVDDHDVHC